MKRVLISCLLFLAAMGVHAQSLIEYYDSELIFVNYHTFGGLAFVHGGVSYSADFGLEQPLRDIIASNPRTAPLIKKHVQNVQIGLILTITGTAATAASAYFLATSLPATEETTSWEAGGAIGFGVAGLILLFAGPFFMQAGYSDLLQAVNIYNRDKIQQYEQL